MTQVTDQLANVLRLAATLVKFSHDVITDDEAIFTQLIEKYPDVAKELGVTNEDFGDAGDTAACNEIVAKLYSMADKVDAAGVQPAE